MAGWHIVRVMYDDRSHEQLWRVIHEILDGPLPNIVLESWKGRCNQSESGTTGVNIRQRAALDALEGQIEDSGDNNQERRVMPTYVINDGGVDCLAKKC